MAEKSEAEEIKALKAQVAEQAKIIEGLNKSLEEKEAENEKLSPRPIYKLGGKTYELADPKSTARIDGKIVTITKQTLDQDKSLLEAVVKKGFGCLQEKGSK